MPPTWFALYIRLFKKKKIKIKNRSISKNFNSIVYFSNNEFMRYCIDATVYIYYFHELSDWNLKLIRIDFSFDSRIDFSDL